MYSINLLEFILNCKIKFLTMLKNKKLSSTAKNEFIVLPKLVLKIFKSVLLSYSIVHAEINFEDTIHDYYNNSTNDSFHNFISKARSNNLFFYESSDEKSDLLKLLEELNILPSSQSLVFSNTSLQLSKIGVNTPRAIYFSDNIYIGFIPNAQLEVIAIDPLRGAIPYIFDFHDLGHNEIITIKRSDKCMRCHSSQKTDYVPGLLLGSVIPMRGGGTLDVLNPNKSSHTVPYEKRFGGWFIDEQNHSIKSWANSVAVVNSKGRTERNNVNFSKNKHLYPFNGSDVVAHIVLEHQVGFTNLCIKIQYKSREELTEHEKLSFNFIKNSSTELLDYSLFLNEPRLESPINKEESQFAVEFEKVSLQKVKTSPLRTFRLKERIFELRCSYMITSNIFNALPFPIKEVFFKELRKLLRDSDYREKSKYNYLEIDECKSIDNFLSKTFTDLYK